MIGRIASWTLALAIAGGGCSIAAAQTTIQGGVELGRAAHSVTDQAILVPAAGTVFGGTLNVTIGRHYHFQGRAMGGKLRVAGSSTPSIDDHSVAEAQLLGGRRLGRGVFVQTGVDVRNFSNALARQHWTMWLIGAEWRVPLGFESMTAAVRGYWMPLVTVSGLPHPDVALAAGLALDWQGQRLGAGMSYTFERYDFPGGSATRRLEDVSTLRVHLVTWWPRHTVKPGREM